MQKSTILIIIAVVAVLVGGYLFATHQRGAVAGTEGTSEIQNAWVEVTSDPVYVDTAGEKSPLKSGDSVGVGATIETGPTGVAIIHFPDSSLARVDVNTTLTLSAISFNTDNNSLIVGIGLSIGRVWSKVIGLATPESSWEVRTSNTVATVRGTAFGVGYKKDGTSWVLGSQHTVAVAPLDPKTKQKIAHAEILLDENKLIQLTNLDAINASTAIGSSTIAGKVTPITGDFRTDAWIRADQAADQKFDAKIDALRAQGASDASVNDEIRKEDIKLQNTLKQTPVVSPPPEVQTKATPPVTTLPVATAKITRVSASRKLGDLAEDDTVQFRAVVGTGHDAQDITDKVSWRLTGPIGSITPDGLFTAQLGSDVSEFGEGTGYVTAVLPNGDVIKSDPIHVQAKIPTGLGTEG